MGDTAENDVLVCSDCEWEFPNRPRYEAHFHDRSFIHATRVTPPEVGEPDA